MDIIERLKKHAEAADAVGADCAALAEEAWRTIESLRLTNASLSAGYDAMSETARKRNAEVEELHLALEQARDSL